MGLKRYKQIFGEFAEEAEFIDETIKKLNLEKDSKILDIGTGMGAMSCLLALNRFNVLTGDPEGIPKSNNSNHEHHHHHNESHEQNHENHDYKAWGNWKESAKSLGVLNMIKFQHFNAQDLPFKGIFLYDSLQHIQNRELALRECIRVLKPEGMIIIIEWTKKQIEEEYKKYGYKIDFINPEDFVNQINISVELKPGKFVNIYILREK
ncbi:MAG: class I SAM-dependent methyltransferase [Promethearchaeota archaeon]|jgi:ubiquinone/menaquinone biosynthesis C-methylase UbiE